MATLSEPVRLELLEHVFRDAVGPLLDAKVSFAIAGSFGIWARGGPRPPMVEDIDVVVHPRDVVDAARALQQAGFRIELPPEGWLVKALHPITNEAGEHVFVDLIHCMTGLPIDDQVLARADVVSVTAMAVPCLAPIDMVTGTLLSITPSKLDYSDAIENTRVLREQFDWDELERRSAGSPTALAFFDLARAMGIDPRYPNGAGPVPVPPAWKVQRLDEASRLALRELIAAGR